VRGRPARISSLLRSLALVAIAAVVCAAQQPPPRFADRVDVSTVVVDVRVIDESGSPVRGLLAPDFFVTIGGKPTRVQSALWTGDGPAPTAPSTRPSLRVADEPGQLLVLLFQKSLLHEHARGLIRLVEQSRTMIRELPASDRIAILSFDTSLKIWSDFTDDRGALDRILERGILHQRRPASVEPGTPSLLDTLKPKAKRVATIEQAFGSIADALSPLPGSKAIVFIGYGMGASPFGNRLDAGAVPHARTLNEDLANHADMNNEYVRARRALTEARVSVFSLDISQSDTHTFAARSSPATPAASTQRRSIFRKSRCDSSRARSTATMSCSSSCQTRSPSVTLGVSVTSNKRAYVYSTSSFKIGGEVVSGPQVRSFGSQPRKPLLVSSSTTSLTDWKINKT
jgi:VWFA-related protein